MCKWVINGSHLGKINCNNHKSVQALNLWPWRQEFLFFAEQSPDPAEAWERAEHYRGCSLPRYVCQRPGSGVQGPCQGLSSPLAGQPLSLLVPAHWETPPRGGEPGLQPPTAHRSPVISAASASRGADECRGGQVLGYCSACFQEVDGKFGSSSPNTQRACRRCRPPPRGLCTIYT